MRTIVKGKCVEETSRMRKGYREKGLRLEALYHGTI